MAGLKFDDIPNDRPGSRGGLNFDDIPTVEIPTPVGGGSVPNTTDPNYIGDFIASLGAGGVKGVVEGTPPMMATALLRMAGDTEKQSTGLWESMHPGEELPWYRKPGSFSESLGFGDDPMETVRNATFGSQDWIRNKESEYLYQPRTAGGR